MTNKILSGTVVVRLAAAAAIAGVVLGCNRTADVESVPLGSPVQLTRQDGGVVNGTLAARDADNVRLTVGSHSRSVARAQIADIVVVKASEPVKLPSLAK